MALVALVLLIASVFVLMTAGVGDVVVMGQKQASRAQFNRRTNYAAYGAMQMALDKLTTDLNYSIDPPEVGDVANDPELVYELAIYNNYNGSFTNPAPDGRWVPKYMVYIRAKADFRAYPGQFTTTLFSKAYVGANASDYAIVGSDNVDIENSIVDAWWVQKDPSTRLYPSSAGRITTNSIEGNCLSIYGNSVVNTSLKWGPFGDEAVCLNLSAPATWNPANNTYINKAAATYPARVARYHPPRDPKNAATGGDIVITSPSNLVAGDYRSLSVTNTTLNLTLPASPLSPPLTLSPYNDNRYYFSEHVTIINSTVNLVNESAQMPADIYVGKKFEVTGSNVNWENAPSQNIPAYAAPPLTPVVNQPLLPSAPPVAHLTQQEIAGPRTMRVFFVGSGAPKFKDCDFISNNSHMALHACGKAMKVQLLDNSILWGGVKGFRVKVKDSYLHYQRVYY